ncbi:hypothetical protein NEFER03_0454 [Nematocida sp. LUAm3]|nr:hypothetical protein NEFER03_0454 [Nematocida sp. LUAm3]KAI5175912.1 hypothetical protein NEFER02_1772 [Nematocida sp. LUAm2]KAI5178706.1 hypothetical protein NEFER01_1825 [Nematocida sp. LUAm1]
MLDNERVERKCFIADITGVMMVGYLSLLFRNWRYMGIVRVLVNGLFSPFSLLLDVSATGLLINTFLYGIYYICLYKWSRGGISDRNLLMCAGLIIFFAQSFQMNIYKNWEKRSSIGMLLLNTLLILCTLVVEGYNVRNHEKKEEKRKGVIRYLLRKISIVNIVVIGGLSLFARYFLFQSTLEEEGFISLVGILVDGILAMVVSHVIFHLHIYNITHFSRGISKLSQKNGKASLYNLLVLREYRENELPNSIKEKNSEILCEYIKDLLYEMETLMHIMIKNQISKPRISSQEKIRDIPEVLRYSVSQDVQMDYVNPNKLLYRAFNYMFLKVLYKRVIGKALVNRRILEKAKRTTWKMEATRRNKLLSLLEKCKEESKKIHLIDASELTNILSLWICYFST